MTLKSSREPEARETHHRIMPKSRKALLLCLVLLTCAFAQGPEPRIRARVSRGLTVPLSRSVPARARAQYDRGAVSASYDMPGMVLRLKPSATQQAALDQLSAEQQDPSSPRFHKWLTPEQFADRFGASQSDVDKITEWLRSEGFSVTGVARSRMAISFRGNAGQVKNTFRAEIRRYANGTGINISNASAPEIPAALSGIVSGISGLNNFKPRPHLRKSTVAATTTGGSHFMAPDDVAVIYNVNPLFNTGLDGTGQKVAVVGQTQIKLKDITDFRSYFSLPAIDLQIVRDPTTDDPGLSLDDMAEADLDIEWVGSVARNSKVIYVYSYDAFSALFYAIDQNIAPVISVSYGMCEGFDMVDLPSYQTIIQQGNVQGITVLAASGDSGAGDCEDIDAAIAQNGPTVDTPSVIPEVTAVGGTMFNEQGGNYWASTNTSTMGSALSYIPEKAWNDTSAYYGFGAGGGGTSSVFPKPSWQTGAGVPDIGFRHTPDVSLNSSAQHVGYYVQTNGSSQHYGGTSVAAPVMAGIVVLLNQKLGTGGVGNINPALYRLAQVSPGAFHDVTVGDNKVPCAPGVPDCIDGMIGYSAGPGFDRATGLGSPDAAALVQAWVGNPAQAPVVSISIDQRPVFRDPAGNNWTFVLTVTEEAGLAANLNSLTIDGKVYDVAATLGSASLGARRSLTSKAITLTGLTVPKQVLIALSGTDSGGRAWTTQYVAPFQDVQTPITVAGASNAASGQQTYAPGMLLSVYGTGMSNYALAASATPLSTYLAGFTAWINGVFTPLYYVSPNQVNLQIPYETPTGNVTLTIGNPYENSQEFTLRIEAAAPGIFLTNGFISAPFSSAKRGETTTLFVTGEGRLNRSLISGSSPSPSTPVTQLPAPRLPVTVTVGGLEAATQFVGIPWGLVGVTQINYMVPSGVATGVQPVVVTVGGVASPPANLTVQ